MAAHLRLKDVKGLETPCFRMLNTWDSFNRVGKNILKELTRHLLPPKASQICLLHGTYTAEVKDETVPCVEALPGHRDLCCTDCSPAFDLQKPLHSYFIGNHMSEARSYTTSLWENKEKSHTCAIASEKIKFLLICYQWAVFASPRREGQQQLAKRARWPRLGFLYSVYLSIHPSYPFP